MSESTTNTRVNLGLLVLRIGIGLVFVYHGLPKITGGVAKWTEIGQAMGMFGITVAPAFWGLMAAVAEFCGGLALIAGFLTRIFAGLMLFTMVVATALMFHLGKGMTGAGHALSMAIVFLSLVVSGPGMFSLDHRLPCRCCCGRKRPASADAPVAP